MNNNGNNDFSWWRLALAVVASSILALALAWFVAPALAKYLSTLFGADTETSVPTSLLILDIIFTWLAFFGCSVLSIKIGRSFPYAAALSVSFAGWAVYFWEVGGLDRMLNSEYPLWYEFFPTHISSGWLAVLLVTWGNDESPASTA